MNLGKLVHATLLFSIASTLVSVSGSATEMQSDSAELRDYVNGAGPSAIFRYGRNPENTGDVFGVVDSALWRIQFYTVTDFINGQQLSSRLQKRGDCELRPDFRVWKVHDLKDSIVLQSQPEVTSKEKLDQGDQRAPFFYSKVVLAKNSTTLAHIISSPTTPAHKRPERSCSEVGPTRFNPLSDASLEITGGGQFPFEIRRRSLPRGADSFLKQKIILSNPSAYLVSAQELESAQLGDQKETVRHVLSTARITGDGFSQPGFLMSTVELQRRGKKASLNRSILLNLGLARVKAGQRFVAISSVGEVLLIGAADKKAFKLYSCLFPGTAKKKVLCSTGSAPPNPLDVDSIEEDAAGSNEANTKGEMWKASFWYTSQEYRVDADQMGCAFLKGCQLIPAITAPPGSEKEAVMWAPTSDLRLAKGVYTRIGVPYAQSTKSTGWPGPKRSTVFPSASETRSSPIALRREEGGYFYVFGDIENEGIVESKRVHVFGIDCSTFVSTLWGIDRRTTIKFIEEANSKEKIGRVASIGATKSGDAFVIHLKTKINHVVMFRESRRAGQYDSSRAVLVVESSSSCGGACWSLYDESFFHGWAIIRNGAPGHEAFKPIPTEFDVWASLFVK